MEEVRRRYIGKVLDAVAGNKTLAAQVLGVDRRTLYRRLDRWCEPSFAPKGTSRETQVHAFSTDKIRKAGGSR
jgi:DNA-binding phage protein